MKRSILLAAILGAVAPAYAASATQQTSPAVSTAPAPQTPAAPGAATAATSPITGDTPIATIMATDAGRAAMTKVFPEVPGHPAYEQFKAMSLRQLQPVAASIITDEKIAALEAAAKAK